MCPHSRADVGLNEVRKPWHLHRSQISFGAYELGLTYLVLAKLDFNNLSGYFRVIAACNLI